MTVRLSKTWSFEKKGIQGTGTAAKNNLTLGIYAINPLNHPNFAAPNGNLTSPFFGQPVTLQGTFSPGNATYNRKVTMQMQWSF
ncbi:MAG TPA: hypothetical protein VE422_41915 [Terriglobia bacterium]|nr:hypothetical protein [Terriglobia bacterium]